jgi:hypothetical protein
VPDPGFDLFDKKIQYTFKANFSSNWLFPAVITYVKISSDKLQNAQDVLQQFPYVHLKICLLFGSPSFKDRIRI